MLLGCEGLLCWCRGLLLPASVTATQWLLPHAMSTTGESKPLTLRALQGGGRG